MRGNMEGCAAADAAAGEIRHCGAGTGGIRGTGRDYKDLPSRIMAFSDAFNKELHDLADAGCSGNSDRRSSTPLAGCAAGPEQRHHARLHAEGFQQHGEGPARQNRSLVPHLSAKSLSSACLHRYIVQAGTRNAESSRCGSDPVRNEKLERAGSRSGLQADYREEDRDQRDQSPHLRVETRKKSPTFRQALKR